MLLQVSIFYLFI